MYWVSTTTRHSTGCFANKIFNPHSNPAAGHSIYWFSTVSPQMHVHSEPVNVILFWNVASADITKLHRIGVGDSLKNGVLTRDRAFGHTDMQRHTEVTWQWRQALQRCVYSTRGAKDCQQPPAARRGKVTLSESGRRQGDSGYTSILAPQVQNCEGLNFCCFKSPSLWKFIPQP